MSEPTSDKDIDAWLAKASTKSDSALAAINRLVDKQRQQRVQEARNKAKEKT